MTEFLAAAAAGTEPLAGSLLAAMDALEALLADETALVRAGKLSEAAALEARKSELAGTYVTISRRLKTDPARASEPARTMLKTAQARHARLRATLQHNMMVVATAHAVAEGLIRGAAGELNRKTAPQTYGAAGRAAPPPARLASPVLLNRSC